MPEKKLILIDTHLHIYDCYNIIRFFKEAKKNFSHYHKKLKSTEKFVGILFLTESKGLNYFEKLQKNSNDIIQNLEKENFIGKKSDENCSIVFETTDSNNIIIIAGQQIITKEKLEVLSLGTRQKIEYSLSLEETVKRIIDIGAIPILPWGVGKWLGQRNGIVNEFLKKNGETRFFLGDNSGRLSIMKAPTLFNVSGQNKKLVLRGSDPLPIKSQEKKAGSFGFYFVSDIDLFNPFKNVKEIIYNLGNEPNNYGKLENIFDFFKNQIMLRLAKRGIN